MVSKSGADIKLKTPSIPICRRSPETEKVSVSSASTSVAVIVAFGIAVWFSAIVNSVVVEVIVGSSFSSATVTVTS